jgi:ubiquitin carboxyl-terminal hydrolase 9/24
MEAKDAAKNGEEHGLIPVEDYTLVGVTVHSGQATGGHYYSFICDRSTGRWLKFDDSDVTEYELTDAKMKKDFFGGTYKTTVWDPQQQRSVLREKERWWNAYMLFYERTERLSPARVTAMTTTLPPLMELTVQEHNLRFQHQKELYNKDFFDFIFKLCLSNTHVIQDQSRRGLPEVDQTLLSQTLDLSLRFFVDYIVRTDVSVRGTAQPWAEVFLRLIAAVPKAGEYLLKGFSSYELMYTVFLLCSDDSVRKVVSLTLNSIIGMITKIYGPAVATTHGEAYFKVRPCFARILRSTLWRSRSSTLHTAHLFIPSITGLHHSVDYGEGGLAPMEKSGHAFHDAAHVRSAWCTQSSILARAQSD